MIPVQRFASRPLLSTIILSLIFCGMSPVFDGSFARAAASGQDAFEVSRAALTESYSDPETDFDLLAARGGGGRGGSRGGGSRGGAGRGGSRGGSRGGARPGGARSGGGGARSGHKPGARPAPARPSAPGRPAQPSRGGGNPSRGGGRAPAKGRPSVPNRHFPSTRVRVGGGNGNNNGSNNGGNGSNNRVNIGKIVISPCFFCSRKGLELGISTAMNGEVLEPTRFNFGDFIRKHKPKTKPKPAAPAPVLLPAPPAPALDAKPSDIFALTEEWTQFARQVEGQSESYQSEVAQSLDLVLAEVSRNLKARQLSGDLKQNDILITKSQTQPNGYRLNGQVFVGSKAFDLEVLAQSPKP